MPQGPPQCQDKYNSCVGMVVYTEAMKRRGAAPRCVGVRQEREGSVDLQGYARQLSADTRSFEFYCLGFSVYPEGGKATPSERVDDRHGGVTMPYCEGLELAYIEELQRQAQQQRQQQQQQSLLSNTSASDTASATIHTATSSSDDSRPSVSSRPAVDSHDSDSTDKQSAVSPSSPSSPSTGANRKPFNMPEVPDMRNFPARWMHTAEKNVERMRDMVTGKGPYTMRSFSSLVELHERLDAQAAFNLHKMQSAANLVAQSLYDRTLKPFYERMYGEEEEDS